MQKIELKRKLEQLVSNLTTLAENATAELGLINIVKTIKIDIGTAFNHEEVPVNEVTNVINLNEWKAQHNKK